VPAEIQAWWSDAADDPEWDSFLAGIPQGQFQQSSLWGRIKAGHGWRIGRIVFTRGPDRDLVGGFQILWRRKGLFRVGYVSKGPVLTESAGIGFAAILGLVQAACGRQRLAAVILQPPDLAKVAWTGVSRRLWLENRLASVISASAWIALPATIEEALQAYAASVRRQIRKSLAGGLSICWVDADGCERFFSLMEQTCRRLGVVPNPASASVVRSLVAGFNASGAAGGKAGARIVAAEVHGETIAGSLLLRFGDRLTDWKTGWAGAGRQLHPNKALVHAAIGWAIASGCSLYDFAGMARKTAEHLLDGGRIASAELQGPDEFKLLFGSRPVLLPEARVWVGSSLFRLFYRLRYAPRR
jgi:CelD/BcsL family acetyltransferase involved in cellulose biosynthesis